MTSRTIRAARRNNPKHAHIDMPDDERDDAPDDQHDGWAPVRERESPILPMRDSAPLDLRAPWQFPTN